MSEKGNFVMLVTRTDDTWIGGNIVEGTARAILAYNIKEVGEKITVRRSLAKFKEIGDV